MKLRNKKTGEVVPASNMSVGIGDNGRWYESLEELNRDYEDYKEPLIKDEKIRKAVRAWAEANGIKKIIIFDCINNDQYTPVFAEFGGHIDIQFKTDEKFNTHKIYTIAELCGEEEE